ncbi:ABC transporter permease [Amorphoplanes nipponensis]|uniref:ABC transporter substrate-binding protein n=1 Tax=Actinoplanes nipponensis TaxID=135950 RepID=A0A919MNK3_9ACTN|nr:ABC transporter permease [Actinoplanes nipponensis]GIE48543.1 ABC transporter substrate-binding protein [Actinoplanes nipponensis]
MFLALRELRFARWRFTLMGSVVALIAVLVVLLSGLSSGLVNDGVSGLQRLPVTAFAFDDGTKLDAAFSRSVVDREQLDQWRRQPGVRDATLFGNLLVNARSSRDVPIDLAMFGVEPGSFLSPPVAEGAALGRPDGIVVSRTALDAGLRVGDTVVIDRIGARFTVIGATADQRTYGHVDVAYVPLAAWQRLHQGAGPGEALRGSASAEATAVAIQADGDLDLAAGDAAAGTTSFDRIEAYGASPGYTAETSTLQLIQAFLYAISALVVGAFFTVWTINRRAELAVLRAMGAARSYLLRDGLVQALVVLGASIGAGIVVGVGLGGLIRGSAVPFAIEAPAVLTAGVLLVVLGLAGAAVAIVRIAAVDPLTALGAQR